MDSNHDVGPSGPCPSRDELHAFSVGKVPCDVLESVAEHVSHCDACVETLTSLESQADTLVSELRQPVVPLLGAESGRQRVIELVAAIGREHFTGQGGAGPSEEPELGEIREYKLLGKLGVGGMGTVYKALHTKLKRVVALKVLPPERMRKPDAVERFQREMEAVGRLDHPNIVRATDAGEVDGTHFLVMELVEGLDLSRLVRRVGPLPVADACEIIRQAAIGLAARP